MVIAGGPGSGPIEHEGLYDAVAAALLVTPPTVTLQTSDEPASPVVVTADSTVPGLKVVG
jgi:hypothetical protein